MSLNTKQWLGVGAVVTGLVVLPVVGAQIWENKQPAPTTNYIKNVETGEMTTLPSTSYRQPNQNYNNQAQGPAAYNNLQRRDMPANEWQSQNTQNDSMGQLIANSSMSSNYNPSSSCEYYAEAGRAGFYHFRFPEASAADLVTINGYKVNRMAVDNLRRMIADARSQGVSLTIGSAFRSVEYQRGIVQRKKAAGQSLSKIYYVSSHPGFSEHHTGLAIDFTPINHGFAKTAGYRWLQNNANNYGFVQTFTPSYSRATGISEESWHWKFTGSPQAQAMLANSQCYLQPKSQWRAS